MRALRTVDGHWQLDDLEAPAPGPGEVVVDVRATGLNHADLLMRTGAYVPLGAWWSVPTDRVAFELAGEVSAVGSDVHGVAVGDRVMAQVGGAAAEQVVVDAALVLPVPDALSWDEAGALATGLLTEVDALLVARRGRIEGANVLVTGAASGVGHLGVQVARALGAAVVVGTTRRQDAVAEIESAGGVAVVDRDGLDLSEHPELDVVLDHVGGATLEQAMARVARDGVVVQIGRLGGGQAQVDLDRLAKQRISLVGRTFRGRERDELVRLHEDVRALGDRWSGVRPVVRATHGFEDAEEAASALSQGGTGKVVLRPSAG